MPSVIFVFQLDTSNGDGPEIDLFTHALHTVIADLVGIQIAAVTFTAAIADLSIIQDAFSALAHVIASACIIAQKENLCNNRTAV